MGSGKRGWGGVREGGEGQERVGRGKRGLGMAREGGDRAREDEER